MAGYLLEKFIRLTRVLPYDEGAARRYGTIKSRFAQFDSAHNLDLMNASIAKESPCRH